jgi:Cu/Ag efflux pump CusA
MKMTHKEEMEYLKKYHPITYYEMGGEDEKSNFGCLTLIVVVIVAIIFTLLYFFVALR